MPVQKIDPKVIFASDAPAIDKPPVFGDKTKGFDVTRSNDGRPTIKQMNKLQQDTDLKILWLNENSVTPYDASIDYPDGAVAIKGGSFKQLVSGAWVEFLDDFADKDAVKRGIANRYDSSLTYNLGERVALTNGDIVKSTVDGNTNDPNVSMTGWELLHCTRVVETVAALREIKNPRSGDVVRTRSLYDPVVGSQTPYIGGSLYVFDETKIAEDDIMCVQGWFNIGLQSKAVVHPEDVGLYCDGRDETTHFDTVVPHLKHKTLDLLGKTLKTQGFYIHNHTKITNGGLDFRGSTIINAQNYIVDGYIKRYGDTRGTSAEWPDRYSTLDWCEGVELSRLNFMVDTDSDLYIRVVRIVKCRDFKFMQNTAAIGKHYLTHIIGGHVGTDLSSVQPLDIVSELLNERCSGVNISGNIVLGTASTGQITNLVSCEDSVIRYNQGYGNLVRLSIDQFCRNIDFSHNNLSCTLDGYAALNPALGQGDTMAYYIGQGSYNVRFAHNTTRTFGKAGLYIEAAKNVSVEQFTAVMPTGQVRYKGTQAAILLQSNVYFMNGQNTPYFGAVAGISIKDCPDLFAQAAGIFVDGYRYTPNNILIDNVKLGVELNLHALEVAATNSRFTRITTSNGSLGLRTTDDCVFEDVHFNSRSNSALYLYNSPKAKTRINKSSFVVDTGFVVIAVGGLAPEARYTIQVTDTELTSKSGSGIYTTTAPSAHGIRAVNIRPELIALRTEQMAGVTIPVSRVFTRRVLLSDFINVPQGTVATVKHVSVGWSNIEIGRFRVDAFVSGGYLVFVVTNLSSTVIESAEFNATVQLSFNNF